jgi:hypothetical protein
MRRIGDKDKRGLSNLVAYVLLISITVSLSFIVYNWLKFYVDDRGIEECPENVNVIVDSYECFSEDGGNFTVNIKNKGFFTVDGYVLRVHNRTGAEFGIYVLNETGSILKPGGKVKDFYDFPTDGGINYVTLVDVQPFLIIEGNKVSCESYASQKVTCS